LTDTGRLTCGSGRYDSSTGMPDKYKEMTDKLSTSLTLHEA
jgi:hypothetical protein